MGITRIGSGDFADVFDMQDGTVIKAFRRVKHTGGDVEEWEDEDALTTELFEAEVRAYERLSELPNLALFTPVYYGRIDPCGLVGQSNVAVHSWQLDLGGIGVGG